MTANWDQAAGPGRMTELGRAWCGAGSTGVLTAQRPIADVMSVRRCWPHSWKASWKNEQGDVGMENQNPSLGRWGWQVPCRRRYFCLTCRLTVLSSSASQPFTHQLPQWGGWERHVRREQRGVRSGPLEQMGAWIDLITVMPVLLQNHFQIFMICQLTSVDTLLGSGINSLQLGNS